MSGILQTALAIVGFVISGAVGWFMVGFVGRPIRQFFDLRGEVIRRMAQYANVSARWRERREDPNQRDPIEITEKQEERLQEAEQVLRDLACQMRSFALNEPWAVRLLKFKYDPLKASAGLFGVSNEIDTKGGSRKFQKDTVAAALCFRDIEP